MSMFRQLLFIMKREIRYMWRDKSLQMILLIGPLLGLLLFVGVYSHQRIDDIPTAIVDLDRTYASQQLINKLENTQDLEIVSYPDTYAQLEEEIKKGEIIVGIVIPENYGRNLALGRLTKVAAFIDGTNMAYATNASTAILTVTRTVGAEAGIKTLVSKGVQIGQAKEAYQSIDFHEEAWFNPTLNYAYFLVLAFALNMWQQFCTLGASMNIIGETGKKSWLQIKSSGISTFKFFLGKSLVHIAVFMLIVLPIYGVVFGLLKFPLAGEWWMLILLTLVFTVALHSLGTFMSSVANNAVNASRFGMMVALPSFVISGYTWPLESMPQLFQPLAWILPQTWFFQGINYLVFKNPGWEFIRHYLLALGLLAVLFYSAATVVTYVRENVKFILHLRRA